jgi:hypothetical protein
MMRFIAEVREAELDLFFCEKLRWLLILTEKNVRPLHFVVSDVSEETWRSTRPDLGVVERQA